MLALELTKSDAYYIRKNFPRSEFYKILDNKTLKVELIDLSINESISKAYNNSCKQQSYTFDRLFCAILNRYGISSNKVVGLTRFNDALYKEREEYMISRVK